METLWVLIDDKYKRRDQFQLLLPVITQFISQLRYWNMTSNRCSYPDVSQKNSEDWICIQEGQTKMKTRELSIGEKYIILQLRKVGKGISKTLGIIRSTIQNVLIKSRGGNITIHCLNLQFRLKLLLINEGQQSWNKLLCLVDYPLPKKEGICS